MDNTDNLDQLQDSFARTMQNWDMDLNYSLIECEEIIKVAQWMQSELQQAKESEIPSDRRDHEERATHYAKRIVRIVNSAKKALNQY